MFRWQALIDGGKFSNVHGHLTDRKLPPHGKMPAIAVPGGFLCLFVETISGNELEKFPKEAIVIHCRISCACLEYFMHL